MIFYIAYIYDILKRALEKTIKWFEEKPLSEKSLQEVFDLVAISLLIFEENIIESRCKSSGEEVEPGSDLDYLLKEVRTTYEKEGYESKLKDLARMAEHLGVCFNKEDYRIRGGDIFNT